MPITYYWPGRAAPVTGVPRYLVIPEGWVDPRALALAREQLARSASALGLGRVPPLGWFDQWDRVPTGLRECLEQGGDWRGGTPTGRLLGWTTPIGEVFLVVRGTLGELAEAAAHEATHAAQLRRVGERSRQDAERQARQDGRAAVLPDGRHLEPYAPLYDPQR
jgi:hypothetical protein